MILRREGRGGQKILKYVLRHLVDRFRKTKNKAHKKTRPVQTGFKIAVRTGVNVIKKYQILFITVEHL